MQPIPLKNTCRCAGPSLGRTTSLIRIGDGRRDGDYKSGQDSAPATLCNNEGLPAVWIGGIGPGRGHTL